MKIPLQVPEGQVEHGYSILEPILELLLNAGNEIATDYRWGSNPTGYFCLLKKPIDFDLIENTFELPPSVQFTQGHGSVDYGLGTAIIRGRAGQRNK